MSATHFLVIVRRLWRLRDELDDAYLVFDPARREALRKREARLVDVALEFSEERSAA